MLPRACFSNEFGLQIKVRLEAKTFSRMVKTLVHAASMWSCQPLCCWLSGGQCSASQWAAGKQSHDDILSDGESCGEKLWRWTVRQISGRCGRDEKKANKQGPWHKLPSPGADRALTGIAGGRDETQRDLTFFISLGEQSSLVLRD